MRYILDSLQGWDRTQWLIDNQLKRWSLAQEDSGQLVILDGDHLKLWYDWIYGIELATRNRMFEYYGDQLVKRKIGFPDRYFLLETDEGTLRARKESDQTRSRRNFEKHLKIVEPLHRFFQALNDQTPSLVRFVDSEGRAATAF